MLKTSAEIAADLGSRIRARRVGLGWTQADTAIRAGVSYRTWRRLEADGKASIDDLVRAAVALRCEQDLSILFPEPVAMSMDELLRQQKAASPPVAKRRVRATSRRNT